MPCTKFLPFTFLAQRPKREKPKRLRNLPLAVEKKKVMSRKK